MITHDTIILGAGPAGIQLGYFLEKQGRDYLIVERCKQSGHSFRLYPRHRQLLSINKRFTGKTDYEFNLRHDWNSLLCDDLSLQMRYYSKDYFPHADSLVQYMEDFVERYALNIQYGTDVILIERDEENTGFRLNLRDGNTLHCRRLVIATGVSKPYIPNISGIELAVGYEDMSLNQEVYENKNVLILGKGNSAFETADHIIGQAAIIHTISPTSVKLAWDTRYVGHVRAVNNNLLDTYQLKSQNSLIDADIIKMWRNPETDRIVVRFHPIHAKQEIEQLEYDFVLRCTGFRFDTDIFAENCKPNMTDCGKLPLMDFSFESKNVKGLFFAGCLTQMLDYKKAQSAFIHGFRYNTECLFHFLEERFYNTPLQTTVLDKDADNVALAILKYFNRTSSLWQQVGFLTDVLVPQGDKLIWYHNLPYGYVMDNQQRFGKEFYTAMFRLNPCPGSTFSHARTSDLYEGAQSTASHPVIERHVDGKVVDSFHVLEDFLADWSGKEYHDALIAFFKAALNGKLFSPEKEDDLAADGSIVRDIIRDANMQLTSAIN